RGRAFPAHRTPGPSGAPPFAFHASSRVTGVSYRCRLHRRLNGPAVVAPSCVQTGNGFIYRGFGILPAASERIRKPGCAVGRKSAQPGRPHFADHGGGGFVWRSSESDSPDSFIRVVGEFKHHFRYLAASHGLLTGRRTENLAGIIH